MQFDNPANIRTSLLCALSVCLLTGATGEPAVGKAARRGGGGGGGGVYLTSPNPTNPLEHNNRAVELGSKQLWPDAIREHEIALEGDPHRTEFRVNLSAAHMQYGKQLAARKRSYEACTEFRRAIYVDPNNAEADVLLSNALKSLGKDADNPEVRHTMADEANNKADWETAVVEYSKYASMKSSTGSAQAEYGYALLRAGKTKEGFKQLKIAVAKEWPHSDKNQLAMAHCKLAEILKDQAYVAKDGGRGTVGMRRLANSAIEYRRAIQLNPALIEAARGFMEVCREAVAIRPTFDNHLALGGAYLLNGDFQHARMEYEQCFKLDPRRPEVSQARIAFHQSVARSPLASDELVAQSVDKVKGSIDSDSENARLWYILGRLRERQADPEKAKKCYDKAWSINKYIDPDLGAAYTRIGSKDPDGGNGTIAQTEAIDPAKLAEKQAKAVADMQALQKEKELLAVENLVNEGKPDEAITKAEALFQADNKNGRVARLLGQAHEKKQELDDAKVWYRLAAGLGDKEADGFLSQLDAARVIPKLKEAEEFEAKSDWVNAASSYRDAITMAPKRADIRRKLADVLNKLGDKEGAKKELDEAARVESESGKQVSSR